MCVISIRFSSGPVRKKPRAGDRRTTKKHGLQIRQPTLAKDHLGRVIGFDCTGGRQNYEWVSPRDLHPLYHCHLTAQEKKEFGHA